MKITLIRHGKANDSLENKKDFDRELTQEGKDELIVNIQKNLKELQSIDLIICSSSKRTRDTCEVVCSFLSINPDKILYEDQMYMFENRYDIFEKLIGVYRQSQHICFIGHDYGLSDFAMYLANNTQRLKTAEIVHFTLN